MCPTSSDQISVNKTKKNYKKFTQTFTSSTNDAKRFSLPDNKSLPNHLRPSVTSVVSGNIRTATKHVPQKHYNVDSKYSPSHHDSSRGFILRPSRHTKNKGKKNNKQPRLSFKIYFPCIQITPFNDIN